MTLIHEHVYVGIFAANVVICTIRAMKKETLPSSSNIEKLWENKMCLLKSSMEQTYSKLGLYAR